MDANRERDKGRMLRECLRVLRRPQGLLRLDAAVLAQELLANVEDAQRAALDIYTMAAESNAQINTAKEQVKTLTHEITILNGKMSAQEQELVKTENEQVKTLTNEITILNGKVSTLEQELVQGLQILYDLEDRAAAAQQAACCEKERGNDLARQVKFYTGREDKFRERNRTQADEIAQREEAVRLREDECERTLLAAEDLFEYCRKSDQASISLSSSAGAKVVAWEVKV
jgi:hypothetical protein